MKLLIFFLSFGVASAFSPVNAPAKALKSTALDAHRRDVLLAGIVGLVAQPAVSKATGSTFFFDEKIELVREEGQMRTDGRIDVNNSFVSEYKSLPGMFPHVAGKIASHGPYANVKSVYKLSGLTDQEKKIFKKYEKEFTANPPGRAFNERINQRFST